VIFQHAASAAGRRSLAANGSNVAYCRQEITLRSTHFAANNRQIAADLLKFAAISLDIVSPA
jgi:hypothetical protein